MHRIALAGGALFLVVVMVSLLLMISKPVEAPVTPEAPLATSTPLAPVASFTLEERVVALGDTLAILPGPTLRTDLTGDGREDEVVVLREATEGSGTFYYVAPVLTGATAYEGGRGYYLGDRIVVTDISFGPVDTIVVEYLERAPGVAMAEVPTELMERVVRYDAFTRSFVAASLPEAVTGKPVDSPTRLAGTRWQWVEALYEDGRTVTPKRPEAFVLTFAADGHFSASTDCNGVGGAYTEADATLSFSDMLSTMMYCEGSDEVTFTTLLGDVRSYRITADGRLVLGLKFDSGSVTFAPQGE